MAVLNRKEEKLQVVLGRLPKKYTDEEFVAMFIKLYSKDWGKIKSTYIKQSQDKEPGTIINMPKPELYLKQILHSFLQKQAEQVVAPAMAKKPETATVKAKKPVVKKASPLTEKAEPKAKTIKKKVVAVEEALTEVKKPKKVATKKAETETKPKAVKKEKTAKS